MTKSTFPAVFAKIVWSPPMAAFFPAIKLVPLWRTKIAPAVTTSPLAALMPKYLGFESLPKREEPVDFAVAIQWIW